MDKPIQFETFREIGPYEIGNLRDESPACWNGVVSYRKFRITVELVDEPREVLIGRIEKLWEECDNHHHYGPLRAVAETLGVTLDSYNLGKARKK